MPDPSPVRLARRLTPWVRQSLDNAKGEILSGLAPGQRLAVRLAWQPLMLIVLPLVVRLGIECTIVLGRDAVIGLVEWLTIHLRTTASGPNDAILMIKAILDTSLADMHPATRKTFSNIKD